MAPERKVRENQYLFDLGVKGRKTGLTLPDTGIRDENGLEPMDHLFSSPEKASTSKKTNGGGRDANASLSSDDMDIAESTVPEPHALISERAMMRIPPPRSKSPIKTYLKSPARRNPSHPPSSPSRALAAAARTTQTTSVRRRLDFGNESGNESFEGNGTKKTSKLTSVPQIRPYAPESDEENVDLPTKDDTIINYGEDSYQLLDGGKDNSDVMVSEAEEISVADPDLEPIVKSSKFSKPKAAISINEEKANGTKRGRRPKEVAPITQEEEEVSPEIEKEPPAKKRGRKPKEALPLAGVEEEAVEEETVLLPPKKRGRKPKGSTAPLADVEQEAGEDSPAEVLQEAPTKKRSRKSIEVSAEASEDQPPIKKAKQAVSKSKPSKSSASKTSKPISGSKKQRLAPIAEADSPEVHRGPPLPRNNRGLLLLRRETPQDGVGFRQTRSGRNSIKPLAYWRNERIDFDEEDQDVVADGGTNFILRKIKEVIRVDDIEDSRPTKSRRKNSEAKSKGGKRSTRLLEPESDDDESEPWESVPGCIKGDVRAWDPSTQSEDASGAELTEDIAFSSAAIETREVGSGATFKFAKTLSQPFFGAGMVDLPPGGEKKPKNSRRMHMAFLVLYGRVEVTVNNTVFRIGKGGTWQVPRGNFYGIYNDYDKPARIFFSQGCEVLAEDVKDE